MRRLAVLLTATLLQLATSQQPSAPLPRPEQETRPSGFYLVGSSHKPPSPKDVGELGTSLAHTGQGRCPWESLSSGTHQRRKRSAPVEQQHFVSQPRVPRYTYVIGYQKVPVPEPEPVAVEQKSELYSESHHHTSEESHSRHETEEHEEEHVYTEEELLLMEQAAKLGGKQTRGRSVRKPVPRKSKAAVRSLQLNNLHSTNVTSHHTHTSTRKLTKTKRRFHKRTKKYRRQRRRKNKKVKITEPNHDVIMQPNAPTTFYDSKGTLHMNLETSISETLDVTQMGTDISGKAMWGVEVDDWNGNSVSYINIGSGRGFLNFVPVSGINSHTDWVFVAKDVSGMTHDIHMSNTKGHLKMTNCLCGGSRLRGILGYDEGGQIVIPVHYQHGHLVVEDVVHARNVLIYN